jgi:pimeloyl-ACP methyl ester carboxylesterase
MDALEIESAVIGGMSMGGYVTFAMFRLAPARFTAMILADTRSAADTPQGREGRVAMRALLGEKGTAGVATALLPKLLSPPAGSGLVDRVRAVIESMPAEAVDAAIGAMMDRPDSTPDLAQVTCAALVAVGKDDVITPVADAESMQRAIRRSTLCVIPDAGHLSNLEQPDAFSRALGDFLLSAL